MPASTKKTFKKIPVSTRTPQIKKSTGKKISQSPKKAVFTHLAPVTETTPEPEPAPVLETVETIENVSEPTISQSTVPPSEEKKAPDISDIFYESKMDNVQDRKNRSLILIIGFFTGIVIAVAVVIYLYSGQLAKTNKPETVVQPTLTPLPTRPEFRRADISFEILNGSGVRGAAAKAASKLERLGYIVVKTGNADKNYKTSQLFLSPEVRIHEALIIAEFNSEFAISSVAGELESGSSPSARLILGSE